MNRRPLVYVAGPITSPEPMANAHRALALGGTLLRTGLVVPFVPHVTCLWQMVDPHSYETWMAYDFEVIHRCDALLRMDGESPGADREVALALDLRLPVFDEADEDGGGIPGLLAWAETWARMEPLRAGVAS